MCIALLSILSFTSGAFGCVFKGLYRQNLEDGHVKVIEVAVKTIKSNSTIIFLG